MRRSRLVLLIALSAVAAALIWAWAKRDLLQCQWACYRVGAAASFQEAQPQIEWFERPAAPATSRAVLVAKWGTGNQRFDLYLARYLGEARCSNALRRQFAAQLGQREELLARWAHWWAWRAPLEPGDQVASVLEYHETLLAEARAQPITWREVLDLQAVFYLTGQPQRARGLSPENWAEHYRVWRETKAALPEITRPAAPLPDWQGPLPERP